MRWSANSAVMASGMAGSAWLKGAVLILAFICAAPFAGGLLAQPASEDAAPAPAISEPGKAAEPPIADARAVPIALLIDADSGQILFSREPDRRFVPASLTKVMSLYLAFERIKEGTIDPEAVVSVDPLTAEEWGGKGSSMFLKAGDAPRWADILTGVATVSANDGSVLLARRSAGSVEAWTEAMTGKARSIGMSQSHFGTPNGWPDEGATFTTARDLARLASAMIANHPQLYARFIGQPGFRWGSIGQSNRDPLLGRFAGADGLKTGYTNAAGFGYVGSAEREGRRLIVVVAGLDDAQLRGATARALMGWGFGSFQKNVVFEAGARIGAARLQGADASHLELVTAQSSALWQQRDGGRGAKVSIEYDGPLRAPIRKGEAVASLVVSTAANGEVRVPLLAARDVAQAGPVGRVLAAFRRWFAQSSA